MSEDFLECASLAIHPPGLTIDDDIGYITDIIAVATGKESRQTVHKFNIHIVIIIMVCSNREILRFMKPCAYPNS